MEGAELIGLLELDMRVKIWQQFLKCYIFLFLWYLSGNQFLTTGKAILKAEKQVNE